MNYILNQIRYICKTYKDRSAGSPSEGSCQKHFARELRKWSDGVSTEEFTSHPKAFLGWIIPVSLLNVISVLLFLMSIWTDRNTLAYIGAGLMTLSICTFILEFVLYYKFIDRLFPKKKSLNIFARRRPSGNINQRIVFGGHADASYEMTYFLKRNTKTSFLVFFGSIAGMLYTWIINIAASIASLSGAVALSSTWVVLGIVALLFVPFFIAGMFFVNWRKIVDGANDNLTACLVSMSVVRKMHNDGIRLKNTEVCCLITGAEESGLRGAMAFAKQHKEEFTDVETVFIALETLHDVNHLQIYNKGINGTQKNSDRVADLLREAGRNCGIDLKDADIYPGATDAEAFSRNAILACGLGGVDHTPQTYYHTRYDTADNINEECIERALSICLEAAQLYDQAFIQEESNDAGNQHHRIASNL